MKNRFIILTISVLIICLFTSCKTDNIRIKGAVEETVEVNTEYIDPGVLYPEHYTLVVEGKINTTILKKQQIKYFVYSDSGELIKELNRFVTVVDTTPPQFTETVHSGNEKYFVGYKYTLENFISDYNDNYTSKENIIVTPLEFTFDFEGIQELNITFTDSLGNCNTFTKNISVENVTLDPEIDFEALLYEIYKNQSHKVHSAETGIGSKYTHVTIDENTSFNYYDSGTIHYLQNISTKLGNRASIQISAPYGEFNKAHISFHISGNGAKYSVGFATIDATKQDISVSQFSSTINDLNLEETKMLEELNSNLLAVLNNFKKYMNDTLNLPFG